MYKFNILKLLFKNKVKTVTSHLKELCSLTVQQKYPVADILVPAGASTVADVLCVPISRYCWQICFFHVSCLLIPLLLLACCCGIPAVIGDYVAGSCCHPCCYWRLCSWQQLPSLLLLATV
jgi:hypothetical protein